MRVLVLILAVCAVVGAAGLGWRRGDAFDGGATGATESTGAIRATGASASAAIPDEGVTRAVARANEALAPDDRSQAIEAAVETRKSSAAASSGSAFYQWVDDRGSVHFVASLDEVPASWRARAGQVELDPDAFTQTAVPAAAPRRPRASVEVAPAARSHDVTVYTAPWCGWCRKTLAFLDDLGVDYVNKDIESDEGYAEELREKSGGSAIPFVEIDGTPIRGFDPGAMVSLLD